MNFAFRFKEIRIVQGDCGLLADAFEEEKIFFIEGSAVGLVHQLDDAENLVFFSQRRRHPRLDLEFTASLDALFETRLFRWCFKELWISRLSNFTEQPLAHGNARTLLHRRIHPRGVGQAEFVSCREPEIAGPGS